MHLPTELRGQNIAIIILVLIAKQAVQGPVGRGTWIRTRECGNQNPMPYRLAIPLQKPQTMYECAKGGKTQTEGGEYMIYCLFAGKHHAAYVLYT